jgi:hypothetical protein
MTIILGNTCDKENSDEDNYKHSLPRITNEISKNTNIEINVQQLLNNLFYEPDLKDPSLKGFLVINKSQNCTQMELIHRYFPKMSLAT